MFSYNIQKNLSRINTYDVNKRLADIFNLCWCVGYDIFFNKQTADKKLNKRKTCLSVTNDDFENLITK